MKRYFRTCKKILIVLLSLFIALPMSFVAVHADNVLRVAYTELSGFFAKDAEGDFTGYGVEYFKQISNLTGYEFQYVDIGSWDNAFDKLQSGEVDVIAPTVTTYSSDYIDTEESIIKNYMVLTALESRKDLYYQDYDQFQSLKIAVDRSTYEENKVQRYIQDKGLNESQLMIYATAAECKRSLEEGSADGMICNVMEESDVFKILDRFGYVEGKITMLAGREDTLNSIDDALRIIQMNYPNFVNNLYEKYYSERGSLTYTREEADLVNSTGELTVSVAPDRYPVTYYNNETGEFEGIAIDILNRIAENTGLQFKFVSGGEKTSPFDAVCDGKTDLALTSLNEKNAPTGTLSFVTSDVLASDIDFATLNGQPFPSDQTIKIAIPSYFKGLSETLKTKETELKVVIYDDIESCINAVRNGSADGIALDTYLMYSLLKSPYYDDIKIIKSFSIKLPYHIAANERIDSRLNSIINLGVETLSTDEVDTIVASYTTYNNHVNTLGETMYSYRFPIIFFAGVLCIIFLFIYLWGRQKRIYAAELIKQNKKLKKATEAKSNFLSNMSHDIRTPMNAIIGLTELAKEEQGNPKETQEYLNKITSSSEFLLGLLNDVLDMSKIENNAMQLHYEPYTCEEYMNSIRTMITPLCDQKHIHFIFTQSGTTGAAQVDKVRFNQIFVNILSNSVKFTPEGGTITYTIEEISNDDGNLDVIHTITDTGCGMSQEFLEHLFEPFSQEENKQISTTVGTGLGLSIAKNLVEMMHGTIHIDSQLGVGTTVIIRIKTKDIANELPDPKKEDVTVSDEILNGKKVLLAEDHPINAEIAKKLLYKKGVTVIWADDGVKAVNCFEQSKINEYDAILMDIKMPNMDGLTASKKIRAMEREDAAAVPIIAMTANAFEDDKKLSRQAGMNAHISKPIDPATVYSTLANEISKRVQGV